jgi:signal transduction histidine kinase
MILFKQFGVAVTGSDLIKQVRKTRIRLGLLITICLGGFLFLQSLFIPFLALRLNLLQGDSQWLDIEIARSNLQQIVVLSSFFTWIILTCLSWILLYFILKPVSENIKEMNAFIANARHELRTPLTILKSEIELMSFHPLPAEVKTDLFNLELQINRLIALVQSLLFTLVRPEAIEKEDQVEIYSLIEELLKSLKRVYKQQDLKVNLFIPQNLIIQTNKTLFTQLLVNILENAYKHVDQGNPLLNIDLKEDKLVFTNTMNLKQSTNLREKYGIIAAQAIAKRLGITILRGFGDGKYTVEIQWN